MGRAVSAESALDAAQPIIEEILRRRRDSVVARRLEDPITWAERRFYIVSTQKPIVLFDHQKAFLKLALTRNPLTNRFPYQTLIYSTIKKSGKSTIGGLIMRWYAETQQPYSELFCVGNDMKQAKDRSFREILWSIENDPRYDHKHERLPGEWEIQKTSMKCLLTNSVIQAIPVDAKGEAGGHPALQTWTEIWGIEHEDGKKFWDELTPIPTLPDSMRIVETYAGFENESETLYGLYKLAVNDGRQLTAGELRDRTGAPLGAFEEATQEDDLVPVYENKAASLLAYWDDGELARRMPWQKGELGKQYYTAQFDTLTLPAFNRLHYNYWVSAESEFIRSDQWDACYDPTLEPLIPGDPTSVVLGVDAASSNDCFAIVAVTRHPVRHDDIAVRNVKIYDPKEQGHNVDFDEAEMYIRFLCTGGCYNRHPVRYKDDWATGRDGKQICESCKRNEFVPGLNVAQIAYDPYQLEQMMQRLRSDGVAWVKAFGQQGDRLKSDKALYDSILGRRISHPIRPAALGPLPLDDPRHDWAISMAKLRQHILNAAAKTQKDSDSTLRLIKASQHRKIDAAVALSMACARASYLNL